MKKVILTLLISTISLSAHAKPNYSYTVNQTPLQTRPVITIQQPMPQTPDNLGTYVNEEITAPISQIGIPEHYLQPQTEEKGLEIEWNEWHANVRNYIIQKQAFSHISYAFKTDSLFCIIFTVHENGSIDDVVVAQFKKNDYEKYKITVNNNEKPRLSSEFSVALKKANEDKYKNYLYKIENYDINTHKESPIDILKHSTFIKELSFLKKFSLTESYVSNEVANNIEKVSGNPILKFPLKSKRDKVVVRQFIAHGLTIEGFIEEYKASDFNDIEKVE